MGIVIWNLINAYELLVSDRNTWNDITMQIIYIKNSYKMQ